MRIGEIAIVAPGNEFNLNFIKAVSDEKVIQTDSLIFGRLNINNQLVIHLYGFEYLEKELNPSWDLVSKKILGYVILFNWNNPESYAHIKSTIDFLTSRYKLPLVIVGVLPNDQTPIPDKLLNMNLQLSEQGQFTFCKITDCDSVKHVLIMLVNAVIEKII